MSDAPWWKTISTDQLLSLRRRLLEYLAMEFGDAPSLGGEYDDVVQQAMVVLFQRRSSVDPAEDGLYRYVRTVARNAALDRIRRAQRRQERIEEVIAHQGRPACTAPDPAAEGEAEKIRQVFCALSDRERLLLWRYVVEGKSIRQIARETNLNWHRVASTIETALQRFRTELSA